MSPFWRDEPLTDNEGLLLALLYQAHRVSTFRQNISTATVVNVATGSGSYVNAMAAGILTLGAFHAPLMQSMEFLIRRMNEPWTPFPNRVPGWGNSFIKDQKDPAWLGVEQKIAEMHPALFDAMQQVTVTLHSEGKNLFPNPGCYTAACAIILRLPARVATFLFISARLDAWTKIAMEHLPDMEIFTTPLEKEDA